MSTKRWFVLAGVLAMSGVAHADTWNLFYDATISPTGPGGNPVVVRMKSDSASMPATPYGYIRYVPSTPFLFQDLNTLSADFNWLQGSYHGGSPRFDIGLDWDSSGTWNGSIDKLVYVYWGTPPNFTDDPADPSGWQNTGNFMTDAATRFQGPGGWVLYSPADAKTQWGNYTVLRAYVSLDAGWGGAQWMDVDMVNINGAVYDAVPEPAGLAVLGVGAVTLLRRRRA